MPVSPLAGQLAPYALWIDVPRLVTAYYTDMPDPSIPAQRVTFGTSGHRGSALTRSFNEWHVLAIAQAVCRYRRSHGIDGPLFLGIDTHALSEPAQASVLEVLAANGVEVMLASPGEYTPTPAVSRAILKYNRGRSAGFADGIVPALLSAEITIRTGRDPAEHYRDLAHRFGAPAERRVQAAATPEQRALLARLAPHQFTHTELAGEAIVRILDRAPGNRAAIGGIKVMTEHGWFAARPSGTEDLYRIYAESFNGEDHVARIVSDAQSMVDAVLEAGTCDAGGGSNA
ncbi:hypothetical protein LGN14_30190 [Burkholderia multivorans]|nr:hypothetical protein [Burkholderia multivorans]MCA8464048.1 hypothetical protein [Burkholderia multivorans]